MTPLWDVEFDIVERFENVSDWHGAGFYTFKSTSREDVERRLGITFPQAYLDLMVELAVESVPAEDILDAYAHPGVESWPKHLVPFFQDGHGNLYCFDTRSASADYPVVFWDHELTRDENLVRAAETDVSFQEWAVRYARDEIPKDEPRGMGMACGIGCVLVFLLLVSLAGVGVGALIHRIRQL